MKKIISFAAILTALVFISGCSLYGSQTATPARVTPAGSTGQPAANGNAVNIQNFAFNPAELTVKVGDTVTWTNNDSVPHQIKSASFNSARLGQGQIFSFTFTSAGTFDYSCAIHPTMTGKIIVE